MADQTRPLVVVAGDADGICDPDSGVCTLPEPDTEQGADVSEPQ
jgi:hypothetical protein